MVEQELLRTRDVARRFAMSDRQVRDMAQQQEIPALKIGGEWRYEPGAIEAWLAQQRTGPGESLPKS